MMMKENAAFFTGNDRYEGYVADILRLVAARLHVDYDIYLSTDGSYGERSAASGHWNGIIGQVVRGVSTQASTPAGPVGYAFRGQQRKQMSGFLTKLE